MPLSPLTPIPTMPARRRRSLAWSLLGGAATVVLWTVLLAWIAGRILTDRYAWSQWLWFAPSPVGATLALLGFLFAMRPAERPRVRRRRMVVWLILAGATGIHLCFIEHRFLRADDDSAEALRIAFWNLSYPVESETAAHVRALELIEGDIVVLASPSDVAWQSDPDADAGAPADLFRSFGVFAVRSRIPILASQPIATGDRVFITAVTFDATALLGRTLVVWLVDLPSEPEWSRLEIARQVRDLAVRLNAPEPDLVVGDLNMPRGSASTAVALPAMRDAYDEAGHGWGATFPRQWPLWHIDRILLADSLRAVDFDIIDPGVGRHRAVAVSVVVK